MKLLFIFVLNVVFASVSAQTLQSVDLKNYSIQKKGVTDLVFEVSNPTLTKNLNEQMIFGKLNSVTFTVYWTFKPERIAINVNGLPEGFKEVKDELKLNILSKIESIISIPLEKKFANYEVTLKSPMEMVGKDKTQQNLIPEYIFKLGAEGELQEIKGIKPVGQMTIKFENQKFPWSDQKWVATKMVTTSEDGPQVTTTTTQFQFINLQNIGLPKTILSKTNQLVRMDPKAKPIERNFEEEMIISKYKVNTGEALKWFISHGTN
jgi:hypothetical protein